VVHSSYNYDAANRLTSVVHAAAGGNIGSYALQYDAAGRITQLTDIDGTTTYNYDNRNELLSANHSDAANPDESYSYDANGNRLSSHHAGAAYQTGSANRLLSDG